MRMIISDFRGKIAHLVYSDLNLIGHLPHDSWSIDLAKALFNCLQNESSLLPIPLSVLINGVPGMILSPSDWVDYEQKWKDKSNHGNGMHTQPLGEEMKDAPGHVESGVSNQRHVASILDLMDQCYDDSAYVRDHFLVRTGGELPEILVNCMIPIQQGGHVPSNELKQLLDSFRCTLTAAELRLKGGDLLVADSLVLVGPETIQTHGGNGIETLQAKLRQIFARDVYFLDTQLGGYPQQLYHIDLYLTVLGEANGLIDLAIGQIYTWDGIRWTEKLTDPMARSLQAYLDLVRSKLPVARFRVIDWPLLLDNGRLYSYNNCLVQTKGANKVKLILPSYAASRTGEELDKFESGDGLFTIQVGRLYEIEWIRVNFHDEVAAKASLRCLTQVLRRSPE